MLCAWLSSGALEVLNRDVNRKPEIWFSVLKPKAGSIALAADL